MTTREGGCSAAPFNWLNLGAFVGDDDEAVRRNRLALLARLHQSMNRVADLSRLAA